MPPVYIHTYTHTRMGYTPSKTRSLYVDPAPDLYVMRFYNATSHNRMPKLSHPMRLNAL